MVDAEGNPAYRPEAVCRVCLLGSLDLAVLTLYGDDDAVYSKNLFLLDRACELMDLTVAEQTGVFSSTPAFNDAPDTTFEMARSMLLKARERACSPKVGE